MYVSCMCQKQKNYIGFKKKKLNTNVRYIKITFICIYLHLIYFSCQKALIIDQKCKKNKIFFLKKKKAAL